MATVYRHLHSSTDVAYMGWHRLERGWRRGLGHPPAEPTSSSGTADADEPAPLTDERPEAGAQERAGNDDGTNGRADDAGDDEAEALTGPGAAD